MLGDCQSNYVADYHQPSRLSWLSDSPISGHLDSSVSIQIKSSKTTQSCLLRSSGFGRRAELMMSLIIITLRGVPRLRARLAESEKTFFQDENQRAFHSNKSARWWRLKGSAEAKITFLSGISLTLIRFSFRDSCRAKRETFSSPMIEMGS